MATRTDTKEKPQRGHILVINSGSSTVKYQLLNADTEAVAVKGVVEGIGQALGKHSCFWIDDAGQKQQNNADLEAPDYAQSFAVIAQVLIDNTHSKPFAIGHRVVHGGEQFIEPSLIDSDVLAKIEQLSALAPLHNPAGVQGIRACLKLFPEVPQVAVFDTAFHHTMPEYAYRYALADFWYSKHNIRRYGFHGTSHRYVAQKAADYLQIPLANLNLITLHLGNGASVAAIEKGQCIDTSMGYTPLEGLVMGTRCGDIDPSIALYMQQAENMSAAQVSKELNYRSGLLGLTGNQDMRELLKRHEEGDTTSELALNLYCYRLKKYIGAYTAALGEVDAIIFTGGIGENSSEIRSQCCDNLNILGIEINNHLNTEPVGQISAISSANSKVMMLVIRTNEEMQIANEVASLLKNW